MEYRSYVSLNDRWESELADSRELDAWEIVSWKTWKAVQISYNWEDYHGYHRGAHGNLHSSAPTDWFRDEEGLHIHKSFRSDTPIVMKVRIG